MLLHNRRLAATVFCCTFQLVSHKRSLVAAADDGSFTTSFSQILVSSRMRVRLQSPVITARNCNSRMSPSHRASIVRYLFNVHVPVSLFQPDTLVTGVVKQIMTYGIFVELHGELRGLVPLKVSHGACVSVIFFVCSR